MGAETGELQGRELELAKEEKELRGLEYELLQLQEELIAVGVQRDVEGVVTARGERARHENHRLKVRVFEIYAALTRVAKLSGLVNQKKLLRGDYEAAVAELRPGTFTGEVEQRLYAEAFGAAKKAHLMQNMKYR